MLKKFFKTFFASLLLLSFLFSPVLAGENKWGNQKPFLGSQIDWGHPLSRGLVGCWILNEGGGNKINSLTQMNNGILLGGFWVPTLKGSALNFTPLNTQQIQIPYKSTIAFPAGRIKIAIVAMVYWSGHGIKVADWIFSQGTEIILRIISSDPQIILNSFTTNDRVSWTTTLPTNKWIMIAGVFDGTNLSIYTDGILRASVVPTGNYGGNTSDFYIDSNQTDEHFAGNIAFVYLWKDNVPSPSEIQQLSIEPYCFVKKQSWIKAGAAAVRRMFMVD